ncbi:MAG: hypothetical protein J4N70_11420, partial [Chloroflexi bacterium]|nr:hypothetical protein [Chloroflexota bacterium]
ASIYLDLVILVRSCLFGSWQSGFFPTSHAAFQIGYIRESHVFKHLFPKCRHLAAVSSHNDLP